MDGDFDYSKLSRAQLEEALTRIDKGRFRVNHQRIVRELEARPAESVTAQEVQAKPSIASLIAWYSLALVSLYVFAYFCVGFVATMVVAVMHPQAVTGADGVPPLLIRSLISITVPLVLYFHLVRTQPAMFLKAAAGIGIVASFLNTAVSYILADAKTPRPATVFFATLILNFAIASLVGTLNGVRQLKPPANNRWRSP